MDVFVSCANTTRLKILLEVIESGNVIEEGLPVVDIKRKLVTLYRFNFLTSLH